MKLRHRGLLSDWSHGHWTGWAFMLWLWTAGDLLRLLGFHVPTHHYPVANAVASVVGLVIYAALTWTRPR